MSPAISGDRERYTHDTTQKLAGEVLSRRHAEMGGREGASNAGSGTAVAAPGMLDARELSDEVLDEISGMDQNQNGGDIDALLKNLLEQKADAAQPQDEPAEAEQAEQANDKKTIKYEDIKVDWQPKMAEQQVVDAGESWGHFQITREVKEMEVPQDAVEKKNGSPGIPDKSKAAPQINNPIGAQAGKSAPPAGAGPREQGGNQGTEKDKNQDQDDLTIKGKGDIKDLPKGADGKTPMVKDGKNPLNDDGEKKEEKGIILGQGAKVYVLDTGTGEKQEIPEDGDLKATHPFKTVRFGKIGRLEDGDTLFWYEWPNQKELDDHKKAKEKGLIKDGEAEPQPAGELLKKSQQAQSPDEPLKKSQETQDGDIKKDPA